jgi:hypothetical protein
MIGAYAIGTFEANYASDPWKEFAKHIDVAIISPIMAVDHKGNNIRTALQEIRATNPTTKIAVYGYDISFPGTNVFTQDYLANLKSNDWVARTSWPGGPWFEVDGPGSQVYSFEPYPGGSLGTADKAVGLTSNQYMAHWFVDAWLKNNEGGFAPSFSLGAYIYDLVDATFFDDTQANLRFPLDPTRGQPFPAGTVGNADIDKMNDLIQQGVVDRYTQTRAITGKEAWLNATFVGNGGGLNSFTTPPRLHNLAPGGVLEAIDGIYNQYGFDPIRNAFIVGNEEIPGPSQVAGFNYIEADGSADLMNVGSHGGQSNFSGQTIPGKEGVLFWFATYLNFAPTIGGAFHASIPFADGTGNYKPDDFVWHDIYSVNRSTGIPYTYPNVDAGRHYLGAALQDPQMLSPQSDGTYRREFQYGYAVVNPTTSTHQITFPQDVHIAGPGTLLPAGTSYSLPAQRGLVVVKVGAGQSTNQVTQTNSTPYTGTFVKPGYPRIAALYIGGDQGNYWTAADLLAKFSFSILSYWPGYRTHEGKTFGQVMQRMHSDNPNTMAFAYVNDNERDKTATTDSVYQKADQMHWWAYDGSGNIVNSVWEPPNFYETNNTPYVQKDSSGYDLPQWFAHWVYNAEYLAENSSIDGFFMDNVMSQPRVDADWNLNGTVDHPTDPSVQTAYQNGYVEYFNAMHSLIPGHFQLGNVACSSVSACPGYSVINGGLLEGMIGYSWSPDTWGGWTAMMNTYRNGMGIFGEPKLVEFGQVGGTTDYQGMRYGLTTTMMDDGYFSYEPDSAYGQPSWFDEYDGGGKLGTGYLGQALSNPPLTPYQNGVYRRDFQNGIVLVNPKGNGAQTIALGGTFKKISGTQDSNVNNGQSVTSVTLKDRDGIVLLK